MPMTRLVYFSENQIDPLQGSIVRELSKILSASNRNNCKNDITGALIFDDMWFLQTLEGERSAVWSTFKRIEHDPRHSNVTIIEMMVVEERVFGNWWMGYSDRNEATASAFAPYLRNGGKLNPPDMTGAEAMALFKSLATIGLSREMVAPKAA